MAVDFSNTQIVTMRRIDPAFREASDSMDFFVPDSTPLKWCMSSRSAGRADRLYGPEFMLRCVVASPEPFTHYFLGGSDECITKLRSRLTQAQPQMKAVGWRNGYFDEESTPVIVEEINELSPDFIWVGLGTPKQQEWIHRWKPRIRRGVLMAVGFAFDVNAGTKKDSPLWMQRAGLGWLFRTLCEPGRLGPRYLKYNTLFLLHLLVDTLRRSKYQARTR